MNERATPHQLEALLAHADWVRALARALLEDEQLAEDVAQETMVAALRRPPRGALKPWMKAVAQNLSRKALRTRVRQHARDRQAARPEQVPERFAAHRRVVEAVDSLAEPYRKTVILRYFEQMAPRDVAAKMQVPVATVRTRLQRAMPLLRTQLDAEFGRDGRSWALGVAALLAPKGGGSSTVGFVTGVGVMVKKIAVAVAVVVVAITGWWVASDAAAPTARRHDVALESSAPGTKTETAEGQQLVARMAAPVVAAGLDRLTARVVDARARPLEGMRVVLTRRARLYRQMTPNRMVGAIPVVLREVRTSADGTARLAKLPGDWTGSLHLHAEGHGWRSESIGADLKRTTTLVCRATRRISIETADESGPVAASVVVSAVDYSRNERHSIGTLDSDENGRGTLDVFPGQQLELIAIDATGCSEAWVGAIPPEGEIPVIRLRLRRDPLRALLVCNERPRAEFQAWLDHRRIDLGASDDQGRLRLLPVPRMRLRDVRFRYPWNHGGIFSVDVESAKDGSLRFVLPFTPMRRRAVLRIQDERGVPLKGALVGASRHVGFGVAGQLVSDESGEVEFGAAQNTELIDRKPVTRYVKRVLVYAAGFAPQVVVCTDEQTEVRLRAGASWFARVVDESGAGVPHAKVYFRAPQAPKWSIIARADAKGRCRLPVMRGWVVSAYVPGVSRKPMAVPDGVEELDVPLRVPPARDLRVVVRDAQGAAVDEPVRLLVSMTYGEERAYVITDGTWADSRRWKGSFRFTATGLGSGMEATKKLHNDGVKALPNPLVLTLAPQWRVRVRPTGIPDSESFQPIVATIGAPGADPRQVVAVREHGEWIDVLVPGGGPWDVEFQRGSGKALFRGVHASRERDPAPTDVSFSKLATFEIDLAEAVAKHIIRVVKRRQSLTAVPVRDGVLGEPTRARGEHVGSSAFRWMLPSGRYHLALGGGRRADGWIWATTEPLLLDPSRPTRVVIVASPVRLAELLPPASAKDVVWKACRVIPQGKLSWLGDHRRIRLYESAGSVRALLWPGRFTIVDEHGKARFGLNMTEGAERVALVPLAE